MRQRHITLIAIAALCTATLPACTTVNLNEMAGPKTAAISTAQPDKNVVQRAVEKLSSTFASRGFVEKTSRKRMQSAAKILLNGLQEKSVTGDNAMPAYVKADHSADAVRADITYAAHHINQTTKAAEVYFEMAAVDRDLRKELKSLQKALMAAHEAQRVFEAALGGQSQTALVEYVAAMEDLRRVTDEFGLRVRTQQVAKMVPLQSAMLN